MALSLFSGLEGARRALMSQQSQLQTIGHNIANVNTPGFTRQQGMLQSTLPIYTPQGSVGTGVRMHTIRQMRDYFLTTQFRRENESLGRWTSMARTMTQVENVFLEPNDNQLNDLLDNFFDAWQGLTTAPESLTARSNLREQAQLLISGFQQNSRRLTDIINNLDDDIVGRVAEINEMAASLAMLNKEIARFELDQHSANDLRDRRDYIIDQLSQRVNVQIIEESTGATRVYMGAMEFVGNDHYQALGTHVESVGNQKVHRIVWENTQIQLSDLGGEIQALVEARDDIVPDYINRLDSLVNALVTQVNAQHTTGYGASNQTGVNFFRSTGLTAITIELSVEVQADVSSIASASAVDSPGNNEIALAIAGLKTGKFLDGNSSTYSEYYSSMVGLVGVRTMQANNAKENYELVLEQLEFSRQSIQGVSLDEEMTKMISAQHAFDAAARMIVTIDEMLGTIVHGLGVGSR